MTYRNVRNQNFVLPPDSEEEDPPEHITVRVEDTLTAVPRGWMPVLPYNNRGRPEDDNVIRDAGWCPKCKEGLDKCVCHKVEDIFDDAKED